MVVALLGLLLFLLHHHPTNAQPDITVEEFTVFALKSVAGSTNRSNTIHYNMRVKNWSTSPAYNDAMNVTFYYKPAINSNNTIKQLIGNVTFGPLYQKGSKDRTYNPRIRRDNEFDGYFEARGVNWGNVSVPVNFRVEVSSGVRYQLNAFFKSKRFSYVIGADLKVDNQGDLIKRKHHKGIELGSNVGRNNMGHLHMLVGLFLFILFCFH